MAEIAESDPAPNHRSERGVRTVVTRLLNLEQEAMKAAIAGST